MMDRIIEASTRDSMFPVHVIVQREIVCTEIVFYLRRFEIRFTYCLQNVVTDWHLLINVTKSG